MRAVAHPRGYIVPGTRRTRWVAAPDAAIGRGVEYTLTGGSSYSRAELARVMAAQLQGATIVHSSPYTFVRIEA